MIESLTVIIVTRHHRHVIEKTLASIRDQAVDELSVLVVDCGSGAEPWMERWNRRPGTTVVQLNVNLGFTGGNNRAWQSVRDRPGHVLFLNPDVIVPRGVLSSLSSVMARPGSERYGGWSVRLHRWDFVQDCPASGVDSTGIFPGFSGWSDRREGSPVEEDRIESVPALCGAFFLAPISLLRSAELSPGVLWDSRYFAYKEDIELSLRLRRRGHSLAMWHGAHVYHGRGWSRQRRDVPRAARLLSARNEVRLDLGYRPLHLPVSLAKWGLVRMFDL